MPAKKKHGLKRFVYQVLIQRLAIVGLIIMTVVSAGVYLIENYELRSTIVERASSRIELFNQEILAYLDNYKSVEKQVFQTQLISLAQERIQSKEGAYVYAGIYDIDSTMLVQVSDKNYQYIDELPKSVSLQLEKKQASTRILRLAGLPHVEITMPLYNRDGQATLYIYGIYAVSQSAVDQFNTRLRRVLIVVMSIVLITTMVLYPVILNLVKKISRYSEDLLLSNLQTIKALGSAIAKRDSDTDAHNYRVTLYSIRLAENLGLDEIVVRRLIKGSFLHDVGKIGVRDNILLKPGRLDEDEFEIMKTHVDHGVDIVNSARWLEDANSVVAAHHEKYDGSGYPGGLKAEAIPVEARIFAIADVFDALTSERPYKKAFTYDKTVEILQQSAGSHFDAEILNVFLLISKDLYDLYSGREDEGLKQEVVEITMQYFTSESSELYY